MLDPTNGRSRPPVDEIGWGAQTEEKRQEIRDETARLIAKTNNWIYQRGNGLARQADSSKVKKEAIWIVIIVLNAAIAILNAISLIPAIKPENFPMWSFPFATTVISVFISTLGLIRNEKKYDQIAGVCEKLSGEFLEVCARYERDYITRVLAAKGSFEAFSEELLILDWLMERRRDISQRSTEEFSRIGRRDKAEAEPKSDPTKTTHEQPVDVFHAGPDGTSQTS